MSGNKSRTAGKVPPIVPRTTKGIVPPASPRTKPKGSTK